MYPGVPAKDKLEAWITPPSAINDEVPSRIGAYSRESVLFSIAYPFTTTYTLEEESEPTI